MIIQIENEVLRVKVKLFGAELCSIYNKIFDLEYLWQAGTEWPKHAPVLFPIVGQVLNNKYNYNGNEYTLNRHGFARESNFEILSHSSNKVSLILKSNLETLKNYPFDFEFIVSYELDKNVLITRYSVVNKGIDEMFFSVGGHPAFNMPLENNLDYTDYTLTFDKVISANLWPLENGQIAVQSIPFLKDQLTIPLTKDLFANDALVFKGLDAEWIQLSSNKGKHGLKFELNNCPYVGIWAAKNADFVCIEPWWGIADSVNAKGTLQSKEGIIKLAEQSTISSSFNILFF